MTSIKLQVTLKVSGLRRDSSHWNSDTKKNDDVVNVSATGKDYYGRYVALDFYVPTEDALNISIGHTVECLLDLG